MKIILFVTCIMLIPVSCNRNSRQQPGHEPEINFSDSVVTPVSDQAAQRIRTSLVVPRPYIKKIVTSGIVKAIPNNYAEIAAPFSGRIIKSFVSLGQKVKVGEPVFEISSPQFFETGKDYYKSKQEMQLAEKNLRRQKDLFNNGVGAQKELEEAEVNYELSKRDYENSVASLKVFNVDPEDLVLGQPLIVRSPINGEIVENKIIIGQYLKEDAEPVAIVAELSKVWVIGQLKEKDISALQKYDSVEVRMTGFPEKPVSGKVFHIGEILDEDTRSVQVFILCNNTSRMLKPGMFVTATFSERTGETIMIPASSVYQQEENPFVFVSTAKNKYIRKSIETGGTDNGFMVIKSGLRRGDEIVTEGGFLLIDPNY